MTLSAASQYANICKHCLERTRRALIYLGERRLTEESIQDWQLGYDEGFGWPGMTNRIIFPLIGYTGNVLAISGRKIGEASEGPKYRHTFGFPYSHWLYGLHLPCESVPVVVEGFMDAILLRQIGWSAYAISGSNLSLWQAAHLTGLSTDGRVLICPDRDKEEAAAKWAAQVKRIGLEPRQPALYTPFSIPDCDPGWMAVHARGQLEVAFNAVL